MAIQQKIIANGKPIGCIIRKPGYGYGPCQVSISLMEYPVRCGYLESDGCHWSDEEVA